ncbi:MAG: response regulator [Proteobacteria bacterium]|nr:response regulator [Pseudomonadota bacterium]
MAKPTESEIGMISRKKSLARDLTLSLILVVSTISIVATFLSYRYLSYMSKKQYEQKASEYIAHLRDIIGHSIWNMDYKGVANVCSAFSKNEMVALIKVTNELGVVLYETEETGETGEFELIRNRMPIRIGKHVAGHIDLALTTRIYKEKNSQLLTVSIFTVLALIIGLVLSTRFVLKKLLQNPLDYLMKRIESIGSGDYEKGRRSYGQREIAVILSKFNTMAERVKSREKSLMEMNDQLETEIAIRKASDLELKRHKDNLEELIEIRTAELQEEVLKHKRTEAELLEAKEAAEAANRAKSAFLANMSHELRTPLNAILGFSQLMVRAPDVSEARREDLGIINRSGEHLLGLINDVLEISKIEAGRISVKAARFDLHRFLRGIAEMFTSRTTAQGLDFILEMDTKLPRFVKADEGKLRQVLINLLGNAVKFTEQGEIILRVSTKGSKTADNGERRSVVLHFEAEDTGIGIPPEDLEKIFDLFVQAGRSGDASSGTGLGLGISRQYVDLMGGEITAESEVDRGSVFRFEISVEESEAVEVIEKPASPRILSLAPDQPEYRILIVEDIRENRILLRRFLEEIGFTVGEAINGKEAVEMFEEWRPHLIIMDMRMPVMNGYEATKRIKSTRMGSTIPIVALTADALEEDRSKIMAVGCEGFIRKPFIEDVLFETLSQHLDARYIYEEVKAAPTVSKVPIWERLTPEILAGLPESISKELKQAVSELDRKKIMAVVERIRERDSSTAKALAEMVKTFQYDKLLDLL